MRTTLNIDPAVLETARILSKQGHMSVGEVISDLARRGMEVSPKASYPKRKFPHFQVPPDAALLNPEVISDLIRDDGIPS